MNLITMTEDRKGHDFRYSINQSKIENELGFKSEIKFKEGLSATIKWYISRLKDYS
jgi:dTDP-glucose 4,6-dehydratase